MPKAILFVNLKKENARIMADEILRELGRRNIQADSFTFKEKADFSSDPGYDIAFSLGGDGTVLHVTRAMAPLGVPVFPVNLGTLGFIAAVRPEEWTEVFDLWLQGKVPLSRRLMLEARIKRGDTELFQSSCLNDIVISASGIAKMIRLQVFSDSGESILKLGQYRSDGLIIATPTGSTAYSVAAGGPVLDPELEAVILNPICPFTLFYRPIVLPARETLIVEVEANQKSGFLTVDGQVTAPLESGDRVFISPSSRPGMLIASDRTAFYHALKTKFSWLETPGKALSTGSESAPENDGVSHA